MTKHAARAATVVAAAALLLGCAPASRPVERVHPGDAPGAVDRTTSVPAVAAVAAASNKTITWHRVLRVLADVPVLPGARAAGRPPLTALAQRTQQTMSPDSVRSTRWWTAPGTVAAALGYVRAHPPRGLQATGSGRFTSPDVEVDSVDFDGPSTHAYNQLTLVVSVTRVGEGVAVRADVEAVWLPRRTADERIGATLTSVDVTVTRPGLAPTLHRTLTGRPARRLADAVNRLPVHPSGVFSCPLDHGDVDTLVFHLEHRDVVVRADLGGCRVVGVTAGHHDRQPLQGGDVVDAVLTEVLDLPPAYDR